MAAVNKYACGLGTIQLDIHPGPLKIKEKSYSTDASPSDMPTNTVKLYQARLLLHCQCNIHACWQSAIPCRELLICCSYNIYACWPSVFTATNTAVFQICLLVECCFEMDACWTLSLNQLACGSFATEFCMSAGLVLLYLPYLLVRCLTISQAC